MNKYQPFDYDSPEQEAMESEPTNDDGQTFAEFMTLVDNYIEAACGMNADCLADFMYADAWIDCCEPRVVALDVLRDNGADDELIECFEARM